MRKLIAILIFIVILSIGVPAFAGTPSWVSLSNGSTVYGYWSDFAGHNVLIECNTDGTPNGKAFINNGKYVTQNVQVLGGYNYNFDTSHPKTAYSPQAIPGPQYKGQYGIPSLYQNSTPIKVSIPYSSPPPEWQWLVFNVYNPNPFPVTAHISTTISTDAFSGDVYFNANETRLLRLKVLNTDTGRPAFYSYLEQNHDPQAPSGTDWTQAWMTQQFDSLQISNATDYSHYCQGLWGLVPGFKTYPTWVPESSDGYWGHIENVTVPGYQWTIVGYLNPTKNYQVCGGLYFNVPYLQAGYFGPFQTTQPAGVYTAEASWTQTSYNNLIDQGTGNIPSDKYPNKVFDHSQGYCGWDTFYWTDSTKTNLIYYYNNYPNNRWYVFSPSYAQSGLCQIGDSTHDMSGFYTYAQYGNFITGAIIKTSIHGYVPIYGSYAQVGAQLQKVTGYDDWGDPIYSNYRRYYLYNYIYNPTPYVVTYQINQGYLEDVTQCSVPASGSVSVQPYSYSVIPITYDYPTYVWGSIGQFGNLSNVQGSNLPLSYEALGWTATNVHSNAVAYDQGNLVGSGTGYYINSSNYPPVVDGSKISYEPVMTSTDLQNFYWTSKVQQILNSTDNTAAWNVVSVIKSHHDSGSITNDYSSDTKVTN